MIEDILKNPAFYAALIALINAVLDYFVPDFPPSIKAAINALLAVIFGAITGTQTVRAARERRATEKFAKTIDGSR